jgi:cytochrome c oxidase subunit 2
MTKQILMGAVACAAATVTIMAAADSPAAGLERGREIFQSCAICHGEEGHGRLVGESHFPAIAGLSAWYVEGQLAKFQAAERGGHADDKQGLMMRGMARSLADADDRKAVAAYVESLAVKPSEAIAGGNAERGKAIYGAVCFACHGDKMQGNPIAALHAPSPRPLEFWYMQEQLAKFKEGIRGSHPNDADGAKMAPIIRSVLPALAQQHGISADDAMKDVLTYIYLNREKN